jgi:hypothetical protein
MSWGRVSKRAIYARVSKLLIKPKATRFRYLASVQNAVLPRPPNALDRGTESISNGLRTCRAFRRGRRPLPPGRRTYRGRSTRSQERNPLQATKQLGA